MRAGAEPYPDNPDCHRASQSSQTDAPSPPTNQIQPPEPPLCERILTQWPPHTTKSANPNNSTRQCASESSHRHHRTPPKPPPCEQILINRRPEQYREISACPHIRNTTEPTHTTLTDAANPTTRMRRHTNHDTSDDKLWPSTTKHHGPYPPACTTQHISQQNLLPRPTTIATLMTPHTQRDTSHIQSSPTRRYVSESSHSRPPDPLHRTRTRAHLDDIHRGSDSASANAESTVSVGRRLHRQHG